MRIDIYNESKQKMMYEIYELIKKNDSHNALSLAAETDFKITCVVDCLSALVLCDYIEEKKSDTLLKREYVIVDDFISEYGIIQMNS